MRQSPVIWGNKDAPLLVDYQQNGFAIFSGQGKQPPTAVLNNILQDIKSSSRPGRITEADGQIIRSQFDIHHQFPELLTILLNHQLLQLASTILGSEPLLYQSHVNFKLGQQGKAYDWHADYTYWRDHDGMLEPRAISVVIPLQSHQLNNGGLELLKQSHLAYYPCALDTDRPWKLDNIRHGRELNRLEKGLVPDEFINLITPSMIHQAEMSLGDFLIMDANTWHYSPDNNSNQDRVSLFIILIAAETPFDESKRNYRPGHISCREGIPLRSFLHGS